MPDHGMVPESSGTVSLVVDFDDRRAGCKFGPFRKHASTLTPDTVFHLRHIAGRSLTTVPLKKVANRWVEFRLQLGGGAGKLTAFEGKPMGSGSISVQGVFSGKYLSAKRDDAHPDTAVLYLSDEPFPFAVVEELAPVKADHTMKAPIRKAAASLWDEETKASLLNRGFCVLKRAVPELYVRQAMRQINLSLFEISTVTKEAPRLALNLDRPTIWSLFTDTSLAETCTFVTGLSPGDTSKISTISLVVPEADLIGKNFHPEHPGFTDEASYAKRLSLAGTLSVAVAVGDQTRRNGGNLCVWPGSHRAAVGPAAFPEQLLLSSGDAVLFHGDLKCVPARNAAPDIRKLVFFRLASHKTEHGGTRWHPFAGLGSGPAGVQGERAEAAPEAGECKEYDAYPLDLPPEKFFEDMVCEACV
ncbi:hypothetical protein DIPPA_02510 [Diplonema papillatum]|nr:hypothetical protein DIPPA_02510 [Diplonema papillatum]